MVPQGQAHQGHDGLTVATTGVHVEGLKEKVKALQQAGVDLDEVKEVMGGIAAEAAQTLASFTPSKTGRLRASVRGNRAKGAAIVTVGRASTPYAGPILRGWPARNIADSHAIEKTDAAMETRAVELLEEGFQAIAERNGLA